MEDEFLIAPGEICSPDEIQIPKLRDLVLLLLSGHIPFVEFCECRRMENGVEAIVFKVEVELAQESINDIHKFEKIAVVFEPSDLTPPEVLALRKDFPKVSHLNVRQNEFPRSLCLYEENYNNLKLSWTAVKFVERIRNWLSLTSKGMLHQEDQPLEPLLLNSIGRIIVPFDLFRGDRSELELLQIRVTCVNNYFTFITKRINSVDEQLKDCSYIATSFVAQPQTHGIIYKTPDNLAELHDFLVNADIDLLSMLKGRLLDWITNKPIKNFSKAKLIIIVGLPKKRGENGVTESIELWAFVCESTIEEIGCQVGAFQKWDNQLVPLFQEDPKLRGEGLRLFPLKTAFSLSKEDASIYNGLKENVDIKIALIGVGALGSQVFNNIYRTGFGFWNLIDEDILLPHNLARHALFGHHVGYSKAETLAYIANNTIDGLDIAKALTLDVLAPNEKKELLDKALQESDLIIDISTSVAVERFLANDVKTKARKMSLFLNPSGTDLVMLREDDKRAFPLDILEMQYYRRLISESGLAGHLKEMKSKVRYSNSCRDLSAVISQELVALHSAIGSNCIRSLTKTNLGAISIWRANEDLSVKCYEYEPYQYYNHELGDWKVFFDGKLLKKLYSFRIERLPNETGGVFIGSFDLQRKILYVVDSILSPSDSKEWPTVYIRGCRGLSNEVKHIEELTYGMLSYVGEWHSHPSGYGILPSRDDMQAFSWLKELMSIDGYPAFMAIVNDNSYGLFLNEMQN